MIEEISDWISPRLGIRLRLMPDQLEVDYPDGGRFLTTIELSCQGQQTQEVAQQERQRAERAEQDNARLRALSQQAGIPDPSSTSSSTVSAK